MKQFVYVDSKELRQLLAAGQLMANKLREFADELDRATGTDGLFEERELAEQWDNLNFDLRKHGIRQVDEADPRVGGLLILSRRVGETLVIGDDVTTTVLGVKGNQVRIGINAPKHISVHREEIYKRIQAEKAVVENG